MRKMFLIVLSLVIVSMFIVGCGTGQAVKFGKSAQKVSANQEGVMKAKLCTDSDGGTDSFEKGITKGWIESYYLGGDKVYQTFEDFCTTKTYGSLDYSGPAGSLNESTWEWWNTGFIPSCTGEPCSTIETKCTDTQNIKRNVFLVHCEFGCSNGACLPAPN